MPLIGRNENMLDIQNTSVPEEIAKKFDIPEYKLFEIQEDSGNYNIMNVLRASRKTNKENTEILKDLGATGLKDGGHYIFFNPTDIKGEFNVGSYSKTNSHILKGALPIAIVASQQKEETTK